MHNLFRTSMCRPQITTDTEQAFHMCSKASELHQVCMVVSIQPVWHLQCTCHKNSPNMSRKGLSICKTCTTKVCNRLRMHVSGFVYVCKKSTCWFEQLSQGAHPKLWIWGREVPPSDSICFLSQCSSKALLVSRPNRHV